MHLIAPDVLFELTTRRINVAELLTCADVRFWAEIVMPDGETERRLQHWAPETTMAALVRALGLPGEWRVTVVPEPVRGMGPSPANASLSLAAMGVVPGCTVRFSRRSQGDAVAEA